MPETSDFINIYIQHLVKEVEELTKTRVLSTARETFKDTEIGELKEKIEELEKKAVEEKDETTTTWKTALAEKDSIIEGVNGEIAQLRRQLDARTNAHNAADIQVQELKKELEEKENVIRSFEVNHKPAQEKKGINKEVPQKGKNKKAVNTAVLLE